jgi:hypothetical protein
MTEIKIPFNDWSEERLKLMVKNATSRTKKYGEPGDTFIVDGTEYMLELVIQLPLWFIAQELFRAEGAMNTIEFIDIWKSIHPLKGYVSTQVVWYHHFKVVGFGKHIIVH